MKKRLICLLLVFSLLLPMFPTTAFATNGNTGVQLENPFWDVKRTDWFYDSVQYARINSFFNGVTANLFSPEGTMTRGMFVTVLGRMAGVDTSLYEGKSAFRDVSPDMYYAPYVTWAAKYGITTGTSANIFSPNEFINREQMATFFVRYFEAFDVDYETGANITTTPADINKVSDYAKDAVMKLWRQGLLNGDGKNFNPKADATRAQAATLCTRMDASVAVWYREPGVPSSRVRLDPTTGLPMDGSTPSEPSNPGTPGAQTCTVNFYYGNTLIDSMTVVKGEPLGALPPVEKSSRANAVLVGYYTDAACTTPFYSDSPVNGNMNVYAKYEEMDSGELITFDSFALMDQAPDVTFSIRRASGTVEAANAATLVVIDGSDPVALSISDSDGNGVYTVSAPAGFNKGATYSLELADGWIFDGKAESIRKASFSIAMEEVENLQMSNEITYIKDTDAISYTTSTGTHDVLTSDVLTEEGGSFTYADASQLAAGDILCIYVGTHPNERNYDGDLLDPAIYVSVSSISGTTVNYLPLDEDDQEALYDVPDNFPILVSELPTGTTATGNINDLDVDTYALMMGEGYDLAVAKNRINVGDYVSMYVSAEGVSAEDDLYFGRITAYNVTTGEFTCTKTTAQEILESGDLFMEVDLSGEDLLPEDRRRALEAQMLSQVEASDFGVDAAYMLADLVTKTDGFQNDMTIQEFLVTGEDGQELSDEEIQLLNLGGNFELTDDIELTVELITSGDQLHYDGGVQLAIGVEAEFEVEVNDDGDKIAIELSATFVQEVTIDPTIKGSLVNKEVLGFIPVPIGVRVNADIDVMSFTALSFEAIVYTVAAEDESTWDKIKGIAAEPIEKLGLEGLSENLVKGFNTVGDVMDKIDELNDMVDKAKAANEQYQGYLDDIEALWDAVEDSDLTSREDWEAMGQELGKSSITSDLLDMMNLTTETGLETEYYEGLDALLERYCEMLEQESDWVTLVEQEIFTAEVCVVGIAIGIEANFVVRADLSLAIGSNLQYEVGKRFSFWFKIGLFKPSAGSKTIDLIDEQFAFQFYVMGRLGVKAGISAKFYVGIGSGKLASVGISAELGPYIKLYGFFIYENTRFRAANTDHWITSEHMTGALFMEFGLYFILSFEANALDDLFEYTYDFLDEEIPLLTAGDDRYYYNFQYKPAEDDVIIIKDEDNNSTTGITMPLPSYVYSMEFLDLVVGYTGIDSLLPKNYIFTVSNPNFSVDPVTGLINVDVPNGTRYMECDLTITYRYGKAAFSTYDMQITVPLVWTNLTTAELSEYYTASVRVGNAADGYQTVWSTRVLKRQPFDLPTEQEIRDLIGWNNYKYIEGNGYGDQDLTDLVIVTDTVYTYDLDYKTYSLTVTGVPGGDVTLNARFGESFDFSCLEGTGINDSSTGTYTIFTNVTTEDTILVNGQNQVIDLTRPIDTKLADKLAGSGITAKANYADNSVKVTFAFTGVVHDDITMVIRRGSIPSMAQAEAVAYEAGLAVQSITPALGAVSATTIFQVVCGELTGEKVTIALEENGGNEVTDLQKVPGSLAGTLPVPEKDGYTFEGWFTDNETFENEFTANSRIPEGGITLYAKWEVCKNTVTFHVNGGNELAEDSKTTGVAVGKPYGTLPVPTQTGYGFAGWYTAADGGDLVTAETVVTIEGDHTLYAHWVALEAIPNTIFSFTPQTFTYEKGVGRDLVYTFNAESGETYKQNEFKISIVRQGDSEPVSGKPINAGVYNVNITRPADDVYAAFDVSYDVVLTINKAIRPARTGCLIRVVESGYTWVKMELVDYNPGIPGVPPILNGGIPDLSEDATVIFNVFTQSGTFSSEPGSPYIWDIPYTGAALKTSVTVIDPNYEDWTSGPSDANDEEYNLYLKQFPTTNWADEGNYDISWWNETDTSFTITTAAQLAGLAYITNNGLDNFYLDTITLGEDIDLSAHQWTPIGNQSHPFTASFDGAGHTISGMLIYNRDLNYAGLFGYLKPAIIVDRSTSTAVGSPCIIKDLVIDDTYIWCKNNVGSIAGYAYTDTVNIRPSDEDNTVRLINCVSYAQVWGNEKVGGLVGASEGYLTRIIDSVFYGIVEATSRAGGIIGGTTASHVINCVNFGQVVAMNTVGGICGMINNFGIAGRIYNCYNVGPVKGAEASYIGAVLGRSEEDWGWVHYGYYLEGSATYGANNAKRTALGKKNAALTDGEKSQYLVSSFTSLESTMKPYAGDYSGMTLMEALTAWLTSDENTVNASPWKIGPNGYPVPITTLESGIRD